jgi:hypothetical protein
VTVAAWRPAGVISIALPSLPLTAISSPPGAMVRPSGPLSALPLVSTPDRELAGDVLVRAFGMAVTLLPIVEAT